MSALRLRYGCATAGGDEAAPPRSHPDYALPGENRGLSLALGMSPDDSLGGETELGASAVSQSPGATAPEARRRTARGAASVHRFCEGLTGGILMLAIVFSPWAFGTTENWSIWVMNAAGYGLGVLLGIKWLVRLATGYRPARWPGADRETSGRGQRWLVAAMAGMTVLFLGYVLVSAVNARALFHADRVAFEYFECVPWLPHSYDRASTWFAFWQYLGLACLFWAARDWLGGMAGDESGAEDRGRRASTGNEPAPTRHRSAPAARMPVRLRRLLTVLCLTGALVGAEGIVQRVAGSNKLLFLVQPDVNTEAENQFGPYANRNNASEYLNLLWPVCAGLALVSAQAAARNRREGWRKPGAAYLWLAAGAVAMGASPFISSSRGGSLIALGLLPAVLVVMLTMTRGIPLRSKVGLGLLFAVAIQLAVVFGWDSLEKRFETVFSDDLNGRVALYKDVETMAKDYQWFGSGAGTFAPVYYLYRSDASREWAGYLHNDWLEFRITLGWVGLSLLVGLLAGAVLHSFLGRGLPLSPILMVLIFLALAGSLVHARLDFPFQVHSVATVFLVYCAMLSRSRRARA